MSDKLTSSEYYVEVKDTAQSIFDEAMSQNDNDAESAQDEANDTTLFETIDGHEYVIYTAYHMEVIGISNNDTYYEDNFGNEYTDFDQLVQAKCFWAFYADVQEKLTELFEEYEPEEDEE